MFVFADRVGVAEEGRQRRETPQHRPIGGDAPQILIPATRPARPMSKHHGGSSVQAQGVAQLLGEREERSSPAGVDRHAGERLDGRAVDSFPLNPALTARGKTTVVERAMDRRGESEAAEDLRQRGRQSEAATPEDDGPMLQTFVVGRQSSRKMLCDCFGIEQRQRGLGEFAAHQRDHASIQRLLERIERVGFVPSDLPDHFGGNQHVARQGTGQFISQGLTQRAGSHQRQIEELSIDREEILAGFMQAVESRLKMLLCSGGIAGQRLARRGQRRGEQGRLVEVAHVPHLPRQQFHLEIAMAQGQKIGCQIGIGGRPLGSKALKGGGDDLIAASKAPQDGAPSATSACPSQPSGSSGRQQSGTMTNSSNGSKGGGRRRQPYGKRLGDGQEFRPPQGRPRRKQLLGVFFPPFQVEVFETLAREQGYEAAEHGVQGLGFGVRGSGFGVRGSGFGIR